MKLNNIILAIGVLGFHFCYSQEIRTKIKNSKICLGMNLYQGNKMVHEEKNEKLKAINASPNLTLGLLHQESFFNNKFISDFSINVSQTSERYKYNVKSPYFNEISDKDGLGIGQKTTGTFVNLKVDISKEVINREKMKGYLGLGLDFNYIPNYGYGSSRVNKIKTDTSNLEYRVFRMQVDSYNKKFYFGLNTKLELNFLNKNNQLSRSNLVFYLNWTPEKISKGYYKFKFTELEGDGGVYGRLNYLSCQYQYVFKRQK